MDEEDWLQWRVQACSGGRCAWRPVSVGREVVESRSLGERKHRAAASLRTLFKLN